MGQARSTPALTGGVSSHAERSGAASCASGHQHRWRGDDESPTPSEHSDGLTVTSLIVQRIGSADAAWRRGGVGVVESRYIEEEEFLHEYEEEDDDGFNYSRYAVYYHLNGNHLHI